MTDQELRDLVASLAVESQKSQENFDKRVKKLEQLVGGIGNNQGDVAEEYFINSLKNSLKLGDMSFDMILSNAEFKTKDMHDEFDILLINNNTIAIVEVKYKVHPNYLEKLPKKIKNLKKLPQYKNYKIYAGVAGFHVTNDVIEQAKQKGYFVLQRKGDVIVTHFDDELKAA